MERRQFNIKVRECEDIGEEVEKILSEDHFDGPGTLSVTKNEDGHYVISFYTTAEIAARIAGYYTEE